MTTRVIKIDNIKHQHFLYILYDEIEGRLADKVLENFLKQVNIVFEYTEWHVDNDELILIKRNYKNET